MKGQKGIMGIPIWTPDTREIGLSHIWDGSMHIRPRGQRGIPRSMGSMGPWELSKDLVRPCQIWSLRHNLYTKLLWLRDRTGRLPKEVVLSPPSLEVCHLLLLLNCADLASTRFTHIRDT